MRKFILLYFILHWFYYPLMAQSIRVSGTVVDEGNRQFLPFVQIELLGQEGKGSIADIDGRFLIDDITLGDELRFSYLGYQPLTIKLDSSVLETALSISLKRRDLEMTEIVVIAGENPAHRIIQAASKNRRQNNPYSLSSFSYECYNKIILYDSLNAPKEGEFTADWQADSSTLPFYYMLMESVSERKYLSASKDQELVLASRVSGFKHPGVAPIATAFQPFSFYNDRIDILDQNYLNPISPYGLKWYQFRLEDQMLKGQDTVFIISFAPKKGKNFDALTGSLYINSNGYAVQNVLAAPAEKGLTHLKIEQRYAYINNEQWFPVQLNFELSFKVIGEQFFHAQGKSYLSKIKIRPSISPKSIGLTEVEMAPSAYSMPDSFWQMHRPRPLSNKEQNSYRFVDSLGKQANLDRLMYATEGLPYGLVYFGPLAFSLSRFVDYNNFEQLRLGAGLYSSSKLSKRFIVGGYFGYGFGDKKWKYGGDFLWKISAQKDMSLQLNYRNDILEPAGLFQRLSWLERQVAPLETFSRRYALSRLDYQQRFELSLHFRLFKYLQLRPFLQAQEISNSYGYQYLSNDGQLQEHFQSTEAGIQLRWTWREQYANFNGFRSLIESKFPILFLSYTQGFSSRRWGKMEYKKLLLGLDAHFHLRDWGKTALSIRAGWIDRPMPYSFLFNGRGSYDDFLGLYAAQTFQSMGLTEFISDRFVYAFWNHNFGKLYQHNFSAPELILHHNTGWGSLQNPEQHVNIEFKEMDAFFLESGLQLNNLIRYPFRDLGYAEFGLACFYRYGAYQYEAILDNMVLKLSIQIGL